MHHVTSTILSQHDLSPPWSDVNGQGVIGPDLHWLKAKFRSVYKILLITHNCLNQNAPKDVMAMLNFGESARTMKLQETSYKNKYGERAFSHVAPKLWNLLPKDIRVVNDTDKFKKMLKSFLMIRGDEYFTWIDRR